MATIDTGAQNLTQMFRDFEEIGRLAPNDIAYIKKSTGGWQPAVVVETVASGERMCIKFLLDSMGHTKSIPSEKWTRMIRLDRPIERTIRARPNYKVQSDPIFSSMTAVAPSIDVKETYQVPTLHDGTDIFSSIKAVADSSPRKKSSSSRRRGSDPPVYNSITGPKGCEYLAKEAKSAPSSPKQTYENLKAQSNPTRTKADPPPRSVRAEAPLDLPYNVKEEYESSKWLDGIEVFESVRVDTSSTKQKYKSSASWSGLDLNSRVTNIGNDTIVWDGMFEDESIGEDYETSQGIAIDPTVSKASTTPWLFEGTRVVLTGKHESHRASGANDTHSETDTQSGYEMYLFDGMIDFDDDEKDKKPISRHHSAPNPTQQDCSWMGLFEEELNIATESSEDDVKEETKPKQQNRRGSNQSYGSKHSNQSYGSNRSHERAFLAALGSIDDRMRKSRSRSTGDMTSP